MQDKLFFTGIPEERLEDTEAVLQNFFFSKEIQTRLQYTILESTKNGHLVKMEGAVRNTIAKVSYYKDRKLIRQKRTILYRN